jgi:long-chain fatty acid transport protein
MHNQRILVGTQRRVVFALTISAALIGQTNAGGLLVYEVGTADVGLASAGYRARAQDASTVLTNPAGMTRLDGTQVLVSGQLMWANTEFSMDAGTSPLLGSEEGGKVVGSDGWLLGGGGFFSYSLSEDLKLGFALAGNFGAPLEYEDDWVGRYYVQKATMLGISLLPSVAYRVNDKLSLGASLNAMYGMYENQVAINNVNPAYGDGRLKVDDNTWGWGVNLGLLYEIDAGTRLGLTWNSEVELDFSAPAEFSNLTPGIHSLLSARGLLNANLDIKIKVPQQLMGSLFMQLDDRWALLANLGWQEWSRFGQIQLGIEDSNNPTSLTTDLDFDDTWHVALGAQYRMSQPWLLNFGVAYDSELQDESSVSPLLPVNSAWRFGIGAQQQLHKTAYWGIAAEYMYGGTLDTELQNTLPVALGGRGDLVGSYENIGTIFIAAYYNWEF